MWAAPASRALRASSRRASSTWVMREGARRGPSTPVRRAKPAPRSLYGPSTSVPLLPGHLANPAFADNRHLYLAGILEVTLYLLGDVVGQLGGDTVVHFGGLDHNPYLTSGLDRIGFVYASVAEGDVLQGAQALYVGLRRLAPGAGAGRRDCVCSGDQHVLHRLHLDLVVVGAYGAHHVVRLTALLRESASDQGVGALDLVVYGLPDIVQQGGSAGDLDVGTELLGHHAAEVGYFDRVGENVLAVGCPVFQRAGWMRPSCTSRSIETRATSRLTGSKLEITTVSGVSSMITSTPVAASKALMFLPSRPITLPFMSSDGRDTALTVDSEVRSEARRSIVVEIRRRASASARSSASRVRSRTMRPNRPSSSVSRSENSLLSASSRVRPEISSSILRWSASLSLSCSSLRRIASSVSVSLRLRSSSSPSRLCRAVSLLSRRSSTRAISARLERTSASASSLILREDSLASRSASRRLVSASSSASSRMDLASALAWAWRVSTRDFHTK